MQITTQSGYIVTLKDKLSFGESRELQKVLFGGMRIKVNDAGKTSDLLKNLEIDLSKMYEYTEKAFPFLVTKIEKDGIEIKGDLYKEVMSWDEADGNAVFEAINALTTPKEKTEESKKKLS